MAGRLAAGKAAVWSGGRRRDWPGGGEDTVAQDFVLLYRALPGTRKSKNTREMASLWSNGEVETKTGDAVTIAEESLERLQQYVKFVFDRKEEKASKVQGLIDKVFAVLGSLDAEAEAALPGKQRARRAYIRGRALDAKEAFDPAAEAHLTRAVKLDPSEIEYWNGLGHVFWKKGDLEAARRSFAKGCGRP